MTYHCPNDGVALAEARYWDGELSGCWKCPMGCMISMYVLGCHMVGVES